MRANEDLLFKVKITQCDSWDHFSTLGVSLQRKVELSVHIALVDGMHSVTYVFLNIQDGMLFLVRLTHVTFLTHVKHG